MSRGMRVGAGTTTRVRTKTVGTRARDGTPGLKKKPTKKTHAYIFSEAPRKRVKNLSHTGMFGWLILEGVFVIGARTGGRAASSG